MNDVKIAVVTLGCEKNLIDSEMILSWFRDHGFLLTTNIADASLILVNTCAFIKDAKEEAINTICDLLETKKEEQKMVVVGCLAERYRDDLMQLFPKVDLFIPIRDYDEFGKKILKLYPEIKIKRCGLELKKRVISTPPYLAYLKISEGCNNNCTYCAIPLIRGKYKSVPFDSLLEDFKTLVDMGYREICLVGQNTSEYGSDLPGMNLAKLLRALTKTKGDYHIRLLYLYPDQIDEELIKTFKEEEKIMPYFDIPVQHGSDRILKLMGRRGRCNDLKNLFFKIRKEIPSAVIRSTLIVGFPGEDDKDFSDLKEFIKEAQLDHLGAFKYSQEDGTKAYSFKNQISERVKNKRYREIMLIQKEISKVRNERYIGKIYLCVADGFDAEKNIYYLRGYMQAPDDIDGLIIVKTDKKLELFKYYRCKITGSEYFDLYGEIID